MAVFPAKRAFAGTADIQAAKRHATTDEHWIDLEVAPTELRLEATLMSGMSFAWRATADHEWSGVLSSSSGIEVLNSLLFMLIHLFLISLNPTPTALQHALFRLNPHCPAACTVSIERNRDNSSGALDSIHRYQQRLVCHTETSSETGRASPG